MTKLQSSFLMCILAGAALPLVFVASRGDDGALLWAAGIGGVVGLGGYGLSHLLTQSIAREQEQQVADTVAGMRGALRTKMGELQNGLMEKAKKLERLSEEQQKKATDAASSAAQATENSTVISSAIEEMNAAIQEIGRQADEAGNVAASAAEKTREADVAASGLSEKSDEILSIVELIRSIASRTNLLALNATIEAARAGDHGKGFAVVANEVKSLANQTAEATAQIEKQINNVREASHNMKSQMSALEEIMARINTTTQVIKKALYEESSATQEIARSAQETSKATQAVTAVISHMLVTTEEIRHSAETMAGAASVSLQD